MDALAGSNASTVFTRAYCQVAWCAPSRNSFLSGRRPNKTRAYGFIDSFRDAPGGQEWVTLPQYFKQSGATTVSIGKVFHPNLPANYDYPQSWSRKPEFPRKPPCPNKAMSCEFDDGGDFEDADAETARLGVEALDSFGNNERFFLALGFQSPRLSWSYPRSAAQRYPDASRFALPKHPNSPPAASAGTPELEWFRPTEVDLYEDIRNITHEQPLEPMKLREVRRAYAAAVTHVDDTVGEVMEALERKSYANNTAVVLFADHGQNLGEHNLWSMMSLMETSLRVPFIIRAPWLAGQTPPTYPYPVELIDIFPTVVGLAGLPPLKGGGPSLDGTDLSPALRQNPPPRLKEAAFSEITRCYDCPKAYREAGDPTECKWDAQADSNFTVPCCFIDKSEFDWMGLSVRTDQWRYSVFCRWDGESLRPVMENCTSAELFDHREDTSLYDVENFENVNVVQDNEAVANQLFAMLVREFQGHSK